MLCGELDIQSSYQLASNNLLKYRIQKFLSDCMVRISISHQRAFPFPLIDLYPLKFTHILRRTKKTSIDAEQEAAYVAMNPEIDAKRAAEIFQRAKATKQMMSEVPSKMNCPGGISSILVPLPKEGTELEYPSNHRRPND
jgi:hypothetical protein